MIGALIALTLSRAATLGVGPPPAAQPRLAGEWRVVSVDGDRPPKGTDISLAFTDAEVSGTGGCNRWRGGYVASGRSIQISGVAATPMACQRPDDPGARVREQKLIALLSAADAVKVGRRKLVITTPTGAILTLERAGR